MDELEARIHRMAAAIDLAEPIDPQEVVERAPVRTRGAARRAFLVAATALVVLVLGAGIAVVRNGPDGSTPPADDSGTPAPEPTAPLAPLRARLELPSTNLDAGDSMTGDVVVDNDTGSSITTNSCGNPYLPRLSNAMYAQEPVWTACYRPVVVPVGTSRWPIDVVATVLRCQQPGGQGGAPDCLPGPAPMPTLAAGTYELRVVSQDDALPLPASVTIEVR
jgi:hypothetical protein